MVDNMKEKHYNKHKSKLKYGGFLDSTSVVVGNDTVSQHEKLEDVEEDDEEDDEDRCNQTKRMKRYMYK